MQLGKKMGAESVVKMLNEAHAALGITPIILLSKRKCLSNIGSKEMLFYVSPRKFYFTNVTFQTRSVLEGHGVEACRVR